MEDLTKQQVVLLTLLVSIITSIATGIVTVSLMDQAPTGATHVINRVIEKTVETVTPSKSQGAAVITKETVIVKAEDQAVKVVENIAPSLVRIFSKTAGTAKENFVGIGMVVSKDGMIVTDSKIISLSGVEYSILMQSGTRHSVSLVTNEKDSPLVVIFASSTPIFYSSMATSTKPESDEIWKPVFFTSDQSVKLGQSIITLSGEDNLAVALGNIRALNESEIVDGKKSIISIQVNADSYDTVTGGPLLNLSGEVVGLKVTGGESGTKDYYVPVGVIKTVIASSSKNFKF